MDENLMFVQLNKPNELRKSILRSALDTTTLLKDFDNIKEIKEEKYGAMENLIGRLKEIKKLSNKMEKHLPKVEIEKPEKRKIKPEKKGKKQFTEKKISKKISSEDDALAEEIMNIEKKLKSI